MLSPQFIARVNRCNDVSELVPLKKIVQIQGYTLGEIKNILRLPDCFIILDSLQNRIVKFDLEGRFVQEVGRKGQGPNEFEYPFLIRHAFDNHLAIFDTTRGRILVLASNGDYVTSYDQVTKQGRIIPGSNFIWKQADSLYLGAYVSNKDTGVWHATLKCSGREFDVINGFGERFEPLKAHKLGVFFLDVFEQIGDEIWVGSPYATTIDVFDLKGGYRRKIGSKPRANGITKDHFANIPKDQVKGRAFRRQLGSLEMHRGICQVGDLVIVEYGKFMCVFDRHGNMIREYLPRARIPGLLDSLEREVYSSLVILQKGKFLSPSERNYLVAELKLDLNQADEFNPFIRVGELALE